MDTAMDMVVTDVVGPMAMATVHLQDQFNLSNLLATMLLLHHTNKAMQAVFRYTHIKPVDMALEDITAGELDMVQEEEGTADAWGLVGGDMATEGDIGDHMMR